MGAGGMLLMDYSDGAWETHEVEESAMIDLEPDSFCV